MTTWLNHCLVSKRFDTIPVVNTSNNIFIKLYYQASILLLDTYWSLSVFWHWKRGHWPLCPWCCFKELSKHLIHFFLGSFKGHCGRHTGDGQRQEVLSLTIHWRDDGEKGNDGENEEGHKGIERDGVTEQEKRDTRKVGKVIKKCDDLDKWAKSVWIQTDGTVHGRGSVWIRVIAGHKVFGKNGMENP